MQQHPGAGQVRPQQLQQQQWPNPAAGVQLADMQQQQRTVSPVPGQQAANPQLQQQLLQLAKGGQHVVQVGNQLMVVPSNVLQSGISPLPLQMAVLQQQQQQQQLQQQQQQQQQHKVHQQGSAGQRRAGSTGAPPAAPKKPGAGGGLSTTGSGTNLAGLGTASQQQSAQQQLQQQILAQQAAAQQAAARAGRPAAAGGMLPLGLSTAGLRPGAYPGQLGPVRPLGLTGLPGSNGASVALHAHHHLANLRPGEAPRLEPPAGTEWMQCMSRDGNPGWYAVPRDKAAALRAAAAKRRAEEGQLGGPPSKQQATAGGMRRKVDDDVTAGASMNVLDVMGADDLQAELALNEAAKGAVVVEQGNVTEEYMLNPGATMTLVAKAAKNSGVRAVGEDVYAFLSLSAEAHLTQLLHSLVRARLQREDLGKGYKGVEKLDDRLRTGLFQIQKREKEAARKREEEQRDELAKLGTTRKKLAEEDKKAAKAAQSARQLEQQQKNLGTTLTKMGIGRRTFAMSSLGRPAGAAAGAKSGFTKPELLEAKAVAAGGTGTAADGSSAGAATAGGGTTVKMDAEAAGTAPAVGTSQQSSAGAGAAAAAGGGGGTAPSVPPVKPVTLQHQLLNAANSADGNRPLGGAVPAFVAGGATATREKDGEEGLRELMLADLIAVLERHPLYCRSQQLYTLYALANQPSSR